ISGHGLRQLHARLDTARPAWTAIALRAATNVTAALNSGVIRLSGRLAIGGVRRARVTGLRFDLATGRLHARVNRRPVVLAVVGRRFAVKERSGTALTTNAQELRFTARAARLLEAATGRARFARVAGFLRLELAANDS